MRALAYIPILLLSFALSACAALSPTSTVDTTKLKQGAFALYGTYTVAREAAASYKVACEKAPTTDCRAVVTELRRLDNLAAPKVTVMVGYARQAEPQVSLLQVAIDGAKLYVEQFRDYSLTKGVQ